MSLSIIIPTYNRGDIFFQCLRSVVKAVSAIEAEVIVVNDDKERALDLSLFPTVKLVTNTGKGVASARNTGAALARYDLLLFIDDDMIISEEAILATLDFHTHYSKACLNLNWVYPPDLLAEISDQPFGKYLLYCGHTTLKGWLKNEDIDHKGIMERPLLASYFLSITKKDFADVGGYDGKFPHAGAEDYDFPRRLKKIGIKFYLNTDVFVYHNERDKTTPEAYLKRYFYNGQTRRVAYEIGYKEMDIQYPPLKEFAIKFIGLFENAFFSFTKLIARLGFLKKLYYKSMFALVQVNIYKGFRVNKKK